MGKWEKYGKKHRKEWENEPLFKGWLTSNPNADGSSYCKLCQTGLRAHHADLKKHGETPKHRKQAGKLDKRQMPISNFGISVATSSIKRKEIILASYIATHTTVRSVDHLTDIINNFNEENNKPSTSSQADQEKFHLHRTKCAAIIKRVIAPSLMSEIVEDVGNSPFSIIVDESTDVSTEKLLCINIRYYSQKKNEIVTQFLTFLSVVQTTAQDLFKVVTEFFESVKLNLQNLIGIGTDGASNLCGRNNSLYTLLKTQYNLSNLVLVKCICHSLHLCGSKASEVFTDETDFLLKETYNWFKNSAVRVSKYKDIFALINTDKKLSKFTQLSTTRWLSRYRAVEKILCQYLELETFFTISAEKERCHTAKLLYEAYKNKRNKVILTFLQPILKEIYRLNLYFQGTNINYYKAFEDVITTIWSLARQIMKPAIINHLDNNLELLRGSMQYDQNYLDLDVCDLGYYFEQELEAANLDVEQITDVKNKCFEFIKRLLKELIERMPTHLNVFSQVKNFSPAVILNQKRPKFSELPLSFVNNNRVGDLEIQYRNLLNIKWEEVFNDNTPEDGLEFWKKVITLKNAAGELMFQDISLLAFTFLSLPSSNAVVERTFSIMNIVKCKIRNKMMLDLLNSIMLVRYHFFVNGICCKTFQPTAMMVSRFNSKMYQNSSENDESSDADEIDEVISFCQDL